MGIQGLLPLLKSIQKPTHLRNFAGQTLGVDAYGWLHRGTVACAIELAQQKPTRRHIDFALSRVRMLIHFGVKPYLVFDGAYLPSKAHTELERATRRAESKKLGMELLAMNKPAQAHLELQKAVDVTATMARELIEELKQLDVPYIVAPYEADSQLAYLEKKGIISGVLSEDSDLLVFGVKCLLTKLDQYGECVMINKADFTACWEISMVGWTDKDFRNMAMLSGCDYLPGISNLGLKTAYRLVRKYKTVDRVVRTLQFEGKKKVPAGYLDAFSRAENTFLYQWVFCPEAQCLANLNKVPVELDVADMPYIGMQTEPEVAIGVAIGDLDPNTKERLPVPMIPSRQPAFSARSMQTPDEKAGKPITDFFKPKRTPLAELDPNSFTPSPSQRRVLSDQQGVSWSASRVEAAQPNALSHLPAAQHSSTEPRSRSQTSNVYPSGWQQGSSKRQRLCSDAALAVSMQGEIGLETATSRFFVKPSSQTTPSAQKMSKKNRDNFELWSDDSTAEAVEALAAAHEVATAIKETPSPKKKQKLQIFIDQNVEQDPQAPEPINHNPLPDPDKVEKILEPSKKPALPTIFDKGIAADFAALKSKCLFQPTESKPSTVPLASAPAEARTALFEVESNAVQSTPRLAPTSPEPATSIPDVAPPRDDDKDDGGDDDDDERIPMSSPLMNPRVDLNIVGATDAAVETNDKMNPRFFLHTFPPSEHQFHVSGSEDFIVPNSPQSVRSEGEEIGGGKPRIDFGRFAYAA